MGQRLGIAAALLGDPQTLILDEPVNGLDPEGVKWVRTLVRRLADAGRTVFLSSHLMSEMAQTADHLVVIGRGRIIADGPIDDILTRATTPTVRVATPDAGTLAPLLIARGATVRTLPTGQLEVTDLPAPAVGDLAAANGVALHELTPVRASLEEAFMELTRDSVEYRSEPTAEGISQ
jgi:ABC-2 type transport system ATP-binding protein